ncbi:hypothetical protein RhiirA4_463827 [Rhizophagus irregularis]|uniref:Uncharacterized protein n=1 Tax=Rhizophagus irregularis TaxID=588596 RepID=A0A2I1GNT6_9GLOM|nr:hypothetical protein RhiirA4_463827 [Rhizophagus irregularis]
MIKVENVIFAKSKKKPLSIFRNECSREEIDIQELNGKVNELDMWEIGYLYDFTLLIKNQKKNRESNNINNIIKVIPCTNKKDIASLHKAIQYSKNAYEETMAAKEEAIVVKEAAVYAENTIKEFIKGFKEKTSNVDINCKKQHIIKSQCTEFTI